MKTKNGPRLYLLFIVIGLGVVCIVLPLNQQDYNIILNSGPLLEKNTNPIPKVRDTITIPRPKEKGVVTNPEPKGKDAVTNPGTKGKDVVTNLEPKGKDAVIYPGPKGKDEIGRAHV